ncbi:hypothetical protein AY522_05535 [Corynebacterium diphtheriae bv. gravis]|uniref:DNA polymerase n=1 Tax=Corynebacterium diphtheriae bv. mitis TaxID=1806053 RepID=A0A854NFH4_CORDP|nr:DNA polymerase bacteriophage-type [Corynebacterium diphtheriae HC02]AVH82679.1 hypothetical protein A6J36_11955 [Corynebacterium diphtheriae]OWM34788.1 hypothetical protein AY602_05615 [Corynebacterium diphtheriae bv. mitis]OWM92334.1 hypothetical protein AY492_05300 [Corynebacterium diphtheriae bv. gravis]KKA81056.1 DNA polymerase [Corynebacterium diphtheriae]
MTPCPWHPKPATPAPSWGQFKAAKVKTSTAKPPPACSASQSKNTASTASYARKGKLRPSAVAIKAMGALTMGLAEHELKPIVDTWRAANPHIVGLWADVEEAAIAAITSRQPIRLCNLRFTVKSGILFIELPSGRRLAYAQPCLGENRWGGTSITYTGITTARRWGQLETYGGKLVENIVQAIARDLLVTSMHAVAQARHKIVMHVHDEIVIDEPLDSGFTATDACELMSTLPAWAEGSPLDADGYECDYYRKD